jgi:hypothetical protein
MGSLALLWVGGDASMDDDPLPIARIASLAIALMLLWPALVVADDGITLYWYGDESDGHLGRETAFASWYCPPTNVPLTVRADWLGIALNDFRPGAEMIITVVGMPAWARTWPELEEVIGNTVVAYVADRPGGEYGDAWRATFSALTNGRLWIGKLYVEIEEVK